MRNSSDEEETKHSSGNEETETSSNNENEKFIWWLRQWRY